MASKNNLKEPQRLTPSEVTRMLSGMSPLQATRYYNRCMTNPNTPDTNLSLLRQFRAQNPDRFLSDEEMAKIPRKAQGSWVSGKGFSGGYRRKDRVYDSDGFSYDDQGRAYDRFGRESGSWHDGGDADYYGYVTADKIVSRRGSGRPFRRKGKPISEPRSIEEIGETLKGMNDPIRARFYLQKIKDNPESNPETVRNAQHFIDVGSTFIASEEQFEQYKANRAVRPQTAGKRGFWQSVRRPVSEARSPDEIAATVTNLRSNVARTRYFDKVISNPESNPQTVDNLIAFKDANPGLFASSEEAANAPREGGFKSRFWKPQEEFDAMSPKERKFFVGAMYRNNRAKNTAYSLRVLTDPDTSQDDRDAMVNVVRRNPLLFFRSAKPGKGGRDGEE